MAARSTPYVIDEVFGEFSWALVKSICDEDVNEWPLSPAAKKTLGFIVISFANLGVGITPLVSSVHVNHPATNSDAQEPHTSEVWSTANCSALQCLVHLLFTAQLNKK